MMYRTWMKRLIDLVISVILLLICSPLFLFVSIVLSFYYRGSPFFLQPRPGKNGRIFTVIKFRTMNQRQDEEGNLLPDAERLTTMGKFIRKTSLDEIPQLLNVIKGDMSLVGPRPLLVEYLPLYSEEQARRHEVRPGITGWAQVNGRNAISWEQKFRYDVWYVDHLSFALDVKIWLMSVTGVFSTEGISQPGHLTIEKFKGNK